MLKTKAISATHSLSPVRVSENMRKDAMMRAAFSLLKN